jgi:hypothetical protein
VSAIKSRVHGSANLSILTHQHALVAISKMFGLFDTDETEATFTSFTAPGSDYEELKIAFLSPLSKQRILTAQLLKRLKHHYMTIYDIRSITNPELASVENVVKVWHRCQVEDTLFHCFESRRENSARLNHLVCVEHDVDINANYGYGAREEEIAKEEFHTEVQFYCVHTFREKQHMLMFSKYRNTNPDNGLVEDLGHGHDGFQDVSILRHVCARVPGFDGKVYIVDDRRTVERNLREALLLQIHLDVDVDN